MDAKKFKRLPYGNSNFESVLTENYAYVDKTHYAHAQIVLSSDWRIDGLNRMKDFFAMYGLDKYFIDVTNFYSNIDEGTCGEMP